MLCNIVQHYDGRRKECIDRLSTQPAQVKGLSIGYDRDCDCTYCFDCVARSFFIHCPVCSV